MFVKPACTCAINSLQNERVCAQADCEKITNEIANISFENPRENSTSNTGNDKGSLFDIDTN